jgi:predicted outer membrane repeat protein
MNGATNFYDGAQHTISLISALPVISNLVTITGPGSGLLTVARSASAPSFGIFEINAFDPLTISLSGLTVSGGSGTSGAGILDHNQPLTLTDVAVRNNTSGGGSGVVSLSQQRLTLTNCTIANNSGGGISGGIYADGPVSLVNCTVTGNTAAEGGGLFIGSYGSLSLTGCTIANNSATTYGGGIAAEPASIHLVASTISGNVAGQQGGGLYLPYVPSAATISDCTIAGNSAATGGGISSRSSYYTLKIQSCTITGNSATTNGGGLYAKYGGAAMDSSIMSGNQSPSGPDLSDPYSGFPITTTYSAIGSTSGFTYTPGTGNLPVGANLHLQPLANNGGPTQTIAFGVGSPLLNAGNPTTTLTTDQRGVPRVIGPHEDIGAYEYQPITVTGVQVNDGSAQRSEVRSLAVTFSGPVSFAGGNGNAAAAFQLQHVQTGDNVNLAAVVSTNGAGQTVVTLTFLPTNVNGVDDTDAVSASNGGQLSLADGRYQLTVFSSAVSDAALGWALDDDANGVPGGNYVTPAETAYSPTALHLYRLFGDATGDGVVDLSDLTAFRGSYNAGTGNPAYLSYLDADNSGVVDSTDLTEFRNRYNHSVFV